VTTPHNHVLIDYENVQPEVASGLGPFGPEDNTIAFLVITEELCG
jgi:hypothetical protein